MVKWLQPFSLLTANFISNPDVKVGYCDTVPKSVSGGGIKKSTDFLDL